MGRTRLDPTARTRIHRLPPVLYREFPVELAARQEDGEEAARGYALTFASDVPIRRRDWWSNEVYYEILSHEPENVDLSRAENGLPFLNSHDRHVVLGSVSDIRIEGGRSHGEAGFSSIPIAQEKQTLVDEGHVRTISVGYQVLSVVSMTEDEDGIATYVYRWMPMEISLEPIPADFGVGIGRGHSEDGVRQRDINPVEFTVEVPTTGGAEEAMGKSRTDVESPTPPVTPETPTSEVRVVADEQAIVERVARIHDLAHLHGMDDNASEWIRAGLTSDQVAAKILELKRTAGPVQPPAESLEGLPEKDRRSYSVRKAIYGQVQVMDGKKRALDGLEGEIHQELTRASQGADHGGVRIPFRILEGRDAEVSRRTLGTTEAAGGAATVGTQIMPDIIDLLRNKARVLELGAKLYSGLQGIVQFNRKDAASTVSWMQENPSADAAASEPQIGYVALKPKTLIGNVQIPRQLIVQSNIDMEADIRNDLGVGTGLAIDLGAIHGLGADNEPMGIWNAAGVLTEAQSGVPSKTTVTAMAGSLAAQNADIGSLAFLTTSELASVLTITPKETGYPVYLWDGTFNDGTMIGFPAKATNQCSSALGTGADEHAMIFGNWNDLIVGLWGNDLEIVVDVVTLAARGQIKLVSYAMADTAVRRGPSFCKGTGAKTA